MRRKNFQPSVSEFDDSISEKGSIKMPVFEGGCAINIISSVRITAVN